MKDQFECHVCRQVKNRDKMRKSMKNRVVGHCIECTGYYRCNFCREVKSAEKFCNQTKKNTENLIYDNGEKIKMRRCYKCDAQLHKEIRNKYLKKLMKEETIDAFIKCNLRAYKKRAKELSLDFDIDKEYLGDLWRKQSGECFYTSEKISLIRGEQNSPSLDRLDPKLGYVKGNVVWTTFSTNTSKSNKTFDEFIAFCKKISENFNLQLSNSHIS